MDGSNVILSAPDENRQALLQYLLAQGRVEPAADGNWRILPVPGVKLRFVSSAAAVAHLARYPQIKRVSEAADGTAVFELLP